MQGCREKTPLQRGQGPLPPMYTVVCGWPPHLPPGLYIWKGGERKGTHTDNGGPLFLWF